MYSKSKVQRRASCVCASVALNTPPGHHISCMECLGILVRLGLVCLVFLFVGKAQARHITTPTRLVPEVSWPNLKDDLNFYNLEQALQRQINRFHTRRQHGVLEGSIRFGQHTYSLNQLYSTVVVMRDLVRQYDNCKEGHFAEFCQNRFVQSLKSRFLLYEPAGGGEQKNETLFTAYHTPLLQASRTQSKEYPYAIYRQPKVAELKRKTREEIIFQHALKGRDLDIFYIKDLFDLYLLQVQGGGRVEYKDAKGRMVSTYLTFDGHNGHSAPFISLYMRKKGYIDNLSIFAQRAFLRKNPHKWREIYSQSPGYVYFRPLERPPEGSDSVSLTPHRSVALDSRKYPLPGVVTFAISSRPPNIFPPQDWNDQLCLEASRAPRTFKRFYVHQDTGSKIRGAARADLYFGEDRYAACVAQTTRNYGQMYFLMLKP